jgi:hypothetical protein
MPFNPMRSWLAALLLVLLALLVLPLDAQRRGGRPSSLDVLMPGRYDSRFTLARLYYPRYPGWSFDWPDMEEHLGRILADLTTFRPNHARNNVFRMDDPELLKYPVAYLSEPGFWFPTETEVMGLREFIDKGGFLIVDDFHFEDEWAVFERAMLQVLPNARIERLNITHPIFNSFFPIMSLRVPYPGRLGEQGLMGEFFGIYDPEDPASRLRVVINYNMDIGDYMEHSPSGMYALAPTNEAYKFGINYLVYGLTH